MSEKEASNCDVQTKVAVKAKESYEKRTGSAGAEGHFMEINLLTLFKLRGDQQLQDFYLAGNLRHAGEFDDVVFRYTDANAMQNIIFLQSKSKENSNHRITIKKFEKSSDWDLQEFFKSFLQIQDAFKKCRNNDPIYRGKHDNLNCNYVIYTNAVRDDSMKEHVVEVGSPINFLFGEKYGHSFKLKENKLKELLQGVLHNIEIEKLIKLLTQMSTKKGSNLHRDDNFKIYYAFFTQTVLVKDGSCWKFRDEFLEGKFQNPVLMQFYERTLHLYAKADTNADIITHMKSCRLYLPETIVNIIPNFSEPLCNEFITAISQCIAESVCKITNVNRNLTNEVAKYVGNVLVFDERKAMFKLNEQNLVGEPSKIKDYLINQLKIRGIDPNIHFDFQDEKFPRLSLGFTQFDSKEIQEFMDKFTILTGQPNVDCLEKIIKGNISDLRDMVDTKYPLIFGKMTAWWKQPGKANYLKKDDRFLSGILSGIHFNLNDPIKSFTGRTRQLAKLNEVFCRKMKAVIASQ